MKKLLYAALFLLLIAAQLLILVRINKTAEPAWKTKSCDSDLSPNGTVSGVSLSSVLEKNASSGAAEYSEASEWEKFSCWAEKAVTYENYSLLGLTGRMTYYFDKNDCGVYYAFTPYEIHFSDEDLSELGGITEFLQNNDLYAYFKYRLYTEGGYKVPATNEEIEKLNFYKTEGDLGSGYSSDLAVRYIQYKLFDSETISRDEYEQELMNSEYLSLYLDFDNSKLIIYQHGWGIIPLPQESELTVRISCGKAFEEGRK